ncbi:MAG: RHS repeat-associated core domain-containing protein [Verrucomicrobiota bacterium]
MKNTHIFLAAVIAATSAVQAATAEHKLPAPLPEFKTPEQLAVWRKEMAAKAATADALAVKQANSSFPISNSKGSSVFYTGKPYIEETGSYAFKFRHYDPETCRWGGADLFGFPDGANNHVYSPTPTMQLDQLGAWRSGTPYGDPTPSDVTDRAAALGAPAYFALAAQPISTRAVSHLINGTTATISDVAINSFEQSAITSSSEFESVRAYVDGYISAAGGRSATLQAANNHVSVTFPSGDLGNSLQNVSFNLAGTITPSFDAEFGRWFYNDSLTITFSDSYDFALGSGWKVDVFARLQEHGWSSAFAITGDWAVTFAGSFPE